MSGDTNRPARARQIGELAGRVLDPVLEKRAGVTASLIHNWQAVAGARLAATTRPEKVQWPRRLSEDDPFEPATLTIAADPAAAFILQHETGEVIARVNAFLGFAAIDRIRIVQKPVAAHRTGRSGPEKLDALEKARLDRSVGGIEDDGLRDALARLGESVIRSKSRK